MATTSEFHPETSFDDKDAPHTTSVSAADDARTVLLNHVSWGAVLAGVVVALVTQLILNMVGVGVGASSIEPGAGDNPALSMFSIGAGVWVAVAGILASFAGGYTSGRLAGKPKASTAGWHGLITWAVTTLIIVYFIASSIGGATRMAAGAAGGLANVTGSAVGTATEAADGAGADPFAAIESAIGGVTGGADAEALRTAAVESIRAVVTGDANAGEEARDRAVQALAEARGIPEPEARELVAQYEADFRETVEQTQAQATEAADTAADAVASGSLIGAIALILGGIAAWFGGRFGTVDPTTAVTALRTRVAGRM
jgi:hypothetical protein